MKNLIVIIGLMLLLGVVFYFTQNALTGNSLPLLGIGKSAKAVIKNQTFNLTVAKTDKQKEIGLSDKKSLAKNSGMLFPYGQKEVPTFWMRGMQFPIDIIFVSDGKIVTLYKNVKPPTPDESLLLYKPNQPIDNVIEINSGLSDKYGFKEGDAVKITL